MAHAAEDRETLMAVAIREWTQTQIVGNRMRFFVHFQDHIKTRKNYSFLMITVSFSNNSKNTVEHTFEIWIFIFISIC